MPKRIFSIITYPLELLYHIFAFPFKIAHIILTDRTGSKRTVTSNGEFNIRSIGHLLFPALEPALDSFCNLYITNRAAFRKKYRNIQTDTADLSSLELIQSFGDLHEKLIFIDWRAEENELEIQDFIEKQMNQEIGWVNANSLRQSESPDKQKDGKFLIKLLHAIDKDLQLSGFRLLFLNMGWDGYVFLPVAREVFEAVLEKAPDHFQKASEF